MIEKFNLPLPIDVDSEKIRKLIKRIGQDMMQDPGVGHMLRDPLKSKLSRIDPGVKIFRCKFRTAPGNQFDVRAQAFKRIEAELRILGPVCRRLEYGDHRKIALGARAGGLGAPSREVRYFQRRSELLADWGWVFGLTGGLTNRGR